MDLELARENMIKHQIRAMSVLDEHVLRLIDHTPRANFVPTSYKKLAYTDTKIPLGHEQTMMLPQDESRMLQALKIQPSDNILEIGTGSGYITALFAQLGKHVCSVDIFSDFTQRAKTKLTESNIVNVKCMTGNAAAGWDVDTPYDVIAITGALTFLPENFRTHLKLGGRLFAIIGEAPQITAFLITRVSKKHWTKKALFEMDIPPLIDAPKKEPFIF